MAQEPFREPSLGSAQEILRRTDRAFRWLILGALLVCALVLLAMCLDR